LLGGRFHLSDERREPEEYEYDLFDDAETIGGIFADTRDPFGSYGDHDAVDDLHAAEQPAPMTGMTAQDGIAAPAPHFDGMAILNSSARVTTDEMVCLAGCKHYTGCVQVRGELRVSIRRCDRVGTWAEQLSLDDANVYGCSHFEADGPLLPHVQARVDHSRRQVRLANERAVNITGHTLGVCHEASCREYVVMVIGAVDEQGAIETQVHRWCRKMGGAARPFKLDPNEPILGCTSVDPGPPHDALDRSKASLEEQNARHAGKDGGERERDQDAAGGPADAEG